MGVCGGLNVRASFVKLSTVVSLFYFAMSWLHLDNAVEVGHTPVGSLAVSRSCMLPCAWYYAFTLGT